MPSSCSRYRRRVPSARSATRPASLSRRRWRETAGRLIGSASAICWTERSPAASSSTIARRLGSPSASNGSPGSGSRAIARTVAEMLRFRAMKSYESEATIDASPDAIWAILTGAPAYAAWDSGVERVEGTIAPGETIKVHSEASPGRAFPVRVTEFRPGDHMTWTGGMPLGLFRGVRTFDLSPGAAGATRFRMREEYSG